MMRFCFLFYTVLLLVVVFSSITIVEASSGVASCGPYTSGQTLEKGCYKDLARGRYVYCSGDIPGGYKSDCSWGGNDCTFPAENGLSFDRCLDNCQSEPGCTAFTYYCEKKLCNLHLTTADLDIFTNVSSADAQVYKMIPEDDTSDGDACPPGVIMDPFCTSGCSITTGSSAVGTEQDMGEDQNVQALIYGYGKYYYASYKDFGGGTEGVKIWESKLDGSPTHIAGSRVNSGVYNSETTGTNSYLGSRVEGLVMSSDGDRLWASCRSLHRIVEIKVVAAAYSVTNRVGTGSPGDTDDAVGASATITEPSGLAQMQPGKVVFGSHSGGTLRTFDETSETSVGAGLFYGTRKICGSHGSAVPTAGRCNQAKGSARLNSPDYIAIHKPTGTMYIMAHDVAVLFKYTFDTDMLDVTPLVGSDGSSSSSSSSSSSNSKTTMNSVGSVAASLTDIDFGTSVGVNTINYSPNDCMLYIFLGKTAPNQAVVAYDPLTGKASTVWTRARDDTYKARVTIAPNGDIVIAGEAESVNKTTGGGKGIAYYTPLVHSDCAIEITSNPGCGGCELQVDGAATISSEALGVVLPTQPDSQGNFDGGIGAFALVPAGTHFYWRPDTDSAKPYLYKSAVTDISTGTTAMIAVGDGTAGGQSSRRVNALRSLEISPDGKYVYGMNRGEMTRIRISDNNYEYVNGEYNPTTGGDDVQSSSPSIVRYGSMHDMTLLDESSFVYTDWYYKKLVKIDLLTGGTDVLCGPGGSLRGDEGACPNNGAGPGHPGRATYGTTNIRRGLKIFFCIDPSDGFKDGDNYQPIMRYDRDTTVLTFVKNTNSLHNPLQMFAHNAKWHLSTFDCRLYLLPSMPIWTRASISPVIQMDLTEADNNGFTSWREVYFSNPNRRRTMYFFLDPSNGDAITYDRDGWNRWPGLTARFNSTCRRTSAEACNFDATLTEAKDTPSVERTLLSPAISETRLAHTQSVAQESVLSVTLPENEYVSPLSGRSSSGSNGPNSGSSSGPTSSSSSSSSFLPPLSRASSDEEYSETHPPTAPTITTTTALPVVGNSDKSTTSDSVLSGGGGLISRIIREGQPSSSGSNAPFLYSSQPERAGSSSSSSPSERPPSQINGDNEGGDSFSFSTTVGAQIKGGATIEDNNTSGLSNNVVTVIVLVAVVATGICIFLCVIGRDFFVKKKLKTKGLKEEEERSTSLDQRQAQLRSDEKVAAPSSLDDDEETPRSLPVTLEAVALSVPDEKLESGDEIGKSVGQPAGAAERPRKQSVVVDAAALRSGVAQQGKQRIPFTKGKCIGQGGFGKVYMARNNSSGGLLAAKELTKDHSGVTDKLLAELAKEINNMKRLDHPNIVKYLGFEHTSADEYFILMEYLPGGSLRSSIQSFGRIPTNVAAKYTRQALLGLSYLHSEGIVHRDIKAANLLLDHEGVLKLSDLGASKPMDESASFTGTPNWMAPEILRSEKGSVAAAGDIWALGCTLMEMLTGDIPFAWLQMNAFGVMRLVGNGGAELEDVLSDLREKIVTNQLDAGHLEGEERGYLFIQKCLQFDPKLRPTTEELLSHPFLTLEESDYTRTSHGKTGLTESAFASSSRTGTDSENSMTNLGLNSLGNMMFSAESPLAPLEEGRDSSSLTGAALASPVFNNGSSGGASWSPPSLNLKTGHGVAFGLALEGEDRSEHQ